MRSTERQTSRGALRAVIACAGMALAAAGCGGSDEAAAPTTPAVLTVASLCSDYLTRTPVERQEATARITAELGAPNAGSPKWTAMLDTRCAQAPDLELGDYFNHFR